MESTADKYPKITKEMLLEFGMKETYDPIYPMEKVISLPQEGDDGNIAICITQMRNASELCLRLPDGAHLYIGIPNSIEDLRTFEKCIGSWEPPY